MFANQFMGATDTLPPPLLLCYR